MTTRSDEPCDEPADDVVVLRGRPTADELAALLAVVLRRPESTASSHRHASRWVSTGRAEAHNQAPHRHHDAD